MFKLEGVTKQFGSGGGLVTAVNDVTLDIDEGEFVALVGPSGSGKSTLLQLLGGMDRPTSGTVSFEGRDLGALADKDLAELRLRTFGFVFQQFNLIPTMSALQNVEAALAPLKMKTSERREVAASRLAEVGLADRVAHLPSQLSGGEQQRVAIARALAADPQLVVGDEPTGNLDTVTAVEMFELLERLNAEGKTILFVTHDRELAARAHRVITIRDGAVVTG